MAQWVKVLDTIIDDPDVSPTALRDMCKLLRNARPHGYWHTDIMNVKEIASVLGVERRNAYHRLRAVEELVYCRVESPHRAHFRVWFLPFVPQEVQEGGFVQSFAQWSVVVSSSKPNITMPTEQQPCDFDLGGGVGGGATRYTLCATLCTLGVADDVALRLVTTYTPDRIELQMAYYEWALGQGKADGPGWLVRAIERGYDPPDEVVDQYERTTGQRMRKQLEQFGDVIDH